MIGHWQLCGLVGLSSSTPGGVRASKGKQRHTWPTASRGPSLLPPAPQPSEALQDHPGSPLLTGVVGRQWGQDPSGESPDHTPTWQSELRPPGSSPLPGDSQGPCSWGSALPAIQRARPMLAALATIVHTAHAGKCFARSGFKHVHRFVQSSPWNTSSPQKRNPIPISHPHPLFPALDNH